LNDSMAFIEMDQTRFSLRLLMRTEGFAYLSSVAVSTRVSPTQKVANARSGVATRAFTQPSVECKPTDKARDAKKMYAASSLLIKSGRTNPHRYAKTGAWSWGK
jgi:hypothetical protein